MVLLGLKYHAHNGFWSLYHETGGLIVAASNPGLGLKSPFGGYFEGHIISVGSNEWQHGSRMIHVGVPFFFGLGWRLGLQPYLQSPYLALCRSPQYAPVACGVQGLVF